MDLLRTRRCPSYHSNLSLTRHVRSGGENERSGGWNAWQANFVVFRAIGPHVSVLVIVGSPKQYGTWQYASDWRTAMVVSAGMGRRNFGETDRCTEAAADAWERRHGGRRRPKAG